jgi:hypothetical protein
MIPVTPFIATFLAVFVPFTATFLTTVVSLLIVIAVVAILLTVCGLGLARQGRTRNQGSHGKTCHKMSNVHYAPPVGSLFKSGFA